MREEVVIKGLEIAADNSLSKDEKGLLLDKLRHEFLTNSGYSEQEILKIEELSNKIVLEIVSKIVKE